MTPEEELERSRSSLASTGKTVASRQSRTWVIESFAAVRQVSCKIQSSQQTEPASDYGGQKELNLSSLLPTGMDTVLFLATRETMPAWLRPKSPFGVKRVSWSQVLPGQCLWATHEHSNVLPYLILWCQLEVAASILSSQFPWAGILRARRSVLGCRDQGRASAVSGRNGKGNGVVSTFAFDDLGRLPRLARWIEQCGAVRCWKRKPDLPMEVKVFCWDSWPRQGHISLASDCCSSCVG